MKRLCVLCLALLLVAAVHPATAKELTLDGVRDLAAMGEEIEWTDLLPYGGTDIGSGMYIRSIPVEGREYSLWAGGDEQEISYLQLRSDENSRSYVDLWLEDMDAFLEWDHRIGRFCYDRVAGMYAPGDPGVNPYPFKNVQPFSVHDYDSVVMRAEAERTIESNAVDVQYDLLADVWMVLFYTSGDADTMLLGGGQSVYMNGDGLTVLIVYGE